MHKPAASDLLVLAPAAERLDVQHCQVALDFLPRTILHSSLYKLAHQLATGLLSPLQHMAFEIADAAAALRQFAHAQHVGKIAVHVQTPVDRTFVACSWAISGGMGALGMMAATWLSGQGQARLVLLGRTGRSVDRLRQL